MKRMNKRSLMTCTLTFFLVFSAIPLSNIIYATDSKEETECTHEHDDTCGYVMEIQGSPCTFFHEHDETCGWALAIEPVPCQEEENHIHDAACGFNDETKEGCTFVHAHDDLCGYVKDKAASLCILEEEHIHDTEICGYIEAVEGKLCQHSHDDTCKNQMDEAPPLPEVVTKSIIPVINQLTTDSALPPSSLKNINMNNTVVGFGGWEWWVIGHDGTGVNSKTGTMTLLSRYNWIGENQMTFGSEYYASSNLKTIMESFYNGNHTIFNEKDRPLILPRELDHVRIEDNYSATLTGNHYVWPLSSKEAREVIEFHNRAFTGHWWTRTTSSNNNWLYIIDGRGTSTAFTDNQLSTHYARPALTINLSAIHLLMPYQNKKLLPSDNLIPLNESSDKMNLYLEDSDLSLNITNSSSITANSKESVSLSYTNATTGPNHYVSMLMQDSSSNNLYYARLANCSSAEGIVNFTVPTAAELTEGTYKLLVFNEQVNGENELDYISSFVEIELNVKTPDLPEGVLAVEFNDNGSGGQSLDNNEMKTAIEAALTSDIDRMKVISLKFKGSADSITSNNWLTLLKQYDSNASLSNLTTLDLSELNQLLLIGNIQDYNFTASRLNHVILPTQLEEIGDGAFYGCFNLSSILFPESLRTIGNDAFDSCEMLVNLSFHDGLETIGEHAFYGCDGLTTLVLPNSLNSIGIGAFKSCDGLISAILPNNIERIEAELFDDCDYLVDVTLPEKLKSIGEHAFDECKRLENIVFPNTLEIIEYAAFDECRSLTEIVFPASLQLIEEYAFDECRRLNKLTFLNEPALTSIEEYAFTDIAEEGKVYVLGGEKNGYTDSWKVDTLALNDQWTLVPIYRLSVVNGTDQTQSIYYQENEQVSIQANAAPKGMQFHQWTTSNGRFTNVREAQTTFIMPGAHTTITATYTNIPDEHTHDFDTLVYDRWHHWYLCDCQEISEKFSHEFGRWVIDKTATEIAAGRRHRDCSLCEYRQTQTIKPVGSLYLWNTLLDSETGIQINGYFTKDAQFSVTSLLAHDSGVCAACDEIRSKQRNGELLGLYNLHLETGQFTDDLLVEIPIDTQFNGQTLLLLTCDQNQLKSEQLVADGGVAKMSLSSLSSLAVAKSPVTAILGLPENHTLILNEKITWTVEPANGTWEFDETMLSMDLQDNSVTFTALKAGNTLIHYSMENIIFTVNLEILNPETRSIPLPLIALSLFMAIGVGGLLIYRRFKGKY